MKKTLVGCILTGIMAAAGNHFVSACGTTDKGYLYESSDVTSKDDSYYLSSSQGLSVYSKEKNKDDVKKDDSKSSKGVLSRAANALKDSAKFALKTTFDVAKTTAGVALGADLAINGKESFAAKTFSDAKDYAQDKYNEAEQYAVTKFNEGKEKIKNKVIEGTRGKESWKNTYNYFANDDGNVGFVDVMKETANNGVELSKEVSSNVYNKAKDVVNKAKDWLGGSRN
jgi:hypothetical protein